MSKAPKPNHKYQDTILLPDDDQNPRHKIRSIIGGEWENAKNVWLNASERSHILPQAVLLRLEQQNYVEQARSRTHFKNTNVPPR
jgi:hypothetical protein